MATGKKGATAGRVRGTSIPGTRVFYRPSLGKIVFRPTNVIRSSDKVIARNEKFAAAKIATRCKGRGWKEFVACLSVEGKKV
ncbi:MAG: hypothetical protein ABIG98_03670 [Chloroflexota bacterium]